MTENKENTSNNFFSKNVNGGYIKSIFDSTKTQTDYTKPVYKNEEVKKSSTSNIFSKNLEYVDITSPKDWVDYKDLHNTGYVKRIKQHFTELLEEKKDIFSDVCQHKEDLLKNNSNSKIFSDNNISTNTFSLELNELSDGFKSKFQSIRETFEFNEQQSLFKQRNRNDSRSQGLFSNSSTKRTVSKAQIINTDFSLATDTGSRFNQSAIDKVSKDEFFNNISRKIANIGSKLTFKPLSFSDPSCKFSFSNSSNQGQSIVSNITKNYEINQSFLKKENDFSSTDFLSKMSLNSSPDIRNTSMDSLNTEISSCLEMCKKMSIKIDNFADSINSKAGNKALERIKEVEKVQIHKNTLLDKSHKNRLENTFCIKLKVNDTGIYNQSNLNIKNVNTDPFSSQLLTQHKISNLVLNTKTSQNSQSNRWYKNSLLEESDKIFYTELGVKPSTISPYFKASLENILQARLHDIYYTVDRKEFNYIKNVKTGNYEVVEE